MCIVSIMSTMGTMGIMGLMGTVGFLRFRGVAHCRAEAVRRLDAAEAAVRCRGQ